MHIYGNIRQSLTVFIIICYFHHGYRNCLKQKLFDQNQSTFFWYKNFFFWYVKKGAEIEMTIRGDTLLYKNAVGGVGTIRSKVFTKALCDTYYGPDPVSPSHKASVLAGIPKL